MEATGNVDHIVFQKHENKSKRNKTMDKKQFQIKGVQSMYKLKNMLIQEQEHLEKIVMQEQLCEK
ncbi:MAG: hypothetical protein ACLUO9_00255 [Coprococcus comes]|uniref:hypothetical protein n=1 Tax=Coprococcus comes TaxID=410072 RepID=UPI001B3C8AA9|nr:hypothetical protein [Coprococcus comes]MBT9781846.1 hypothetical protein [Coprococcus comes]